ncbi:MAG: hypothetical protein L3K26_03290, partial [Candidatus Hydrogenedentes bacterium]|nr:hypothetical protein [Candidatus Hydrogenedentota bacterium]
MIEVLQSEIDGTLSTREIVATFNFETVDLQETQLAQEAAVAEVPDNYRVDNQRVEQQLSSLQAQIDAIKE